MLSEAAVGGVASDCKAVFAWCVFSVGGAPCVGWDGEERDTSARPRPAAIRGTANTKGRRRCARRIPVGWAPEAWALMAETSLQSIGDNRAIPLSLLVIIVAGFGSLDNI